MSTGGITFSGVGSGLPIQTWIEQLVAAQRVPIDNLITKKSSYNRIKNTLNSVESDFRALKTSVQKLTDSNIASSFDIFNARLATSSDTSIATVTASNSAAVQNLTLSVESLATSTKAQNSNFGATIGGTDVFTNIANKQGEEGTFSFYVNGVKKEVTVAETDTLDNIVTKINTAGGGNITASITDGKFKMAYNTSAVTSLKLGSNADTSNFFNVMQLSTAPLADEGGGNYSFSSISQINKINLSGAVVGNAANLNITGDPITAGTFKIGKAEFTITETTTLSSIVSNINRNSDAGVMAQIDTKTNKLILTAKEAGNTAINLENGTSNFLSQVGLIVNGNALTSQIATMGTNAKVYLNGSSTAIEVNSNTITGTTSGISGLTINLKKVTESGETIDININQDTDQIKSVLDEFITKYNKVLSSVDYNTAKDKDLHGEYSLINIKNSVRTLTTGRISGLSDYDSLAMIGISTGKVGKSADDTSTSLKMDTNTFLEALQTNPDQVRTLLIGDSEAGITGLFQNLENKLESVLDPVSGYFEARDDSMNSSIASIDKSITRGEDRLLTYKEMITKQFSNMDQYISQMQQQSQSISSL